MSSTIYRIQSYNNQAIYAYGTEDQARAYCDHLDAGREVDLHTATEATADEKAEHADDCLILDDELSAISNA